MARPWTVICPVALSAPSEISRRRASVSVPIGGGVRNDRSSLPHCASSSASGARSAASISAGGKAGNAPSSPLVQSG